MVRGLLSADPGAANSLRRADMERFEQWRRSAGVSLELAARLWAEGIRSPETLLVRASNEEGRTALHRCAGCDELQLLVLVRAAQSFRERE